MTNQFYDLKFSREPDGSICLEQQFGVDEPRAIYLHPAQLRHVAETFGLVIPNYTADELAERLARQLCEIQRELADECHRSHWLEMTFTKLDAYCSCLPESIFPYDLWPDEAEPEAPAKATEKPTGKATAEPSAMPDPVTASHADVTHRPPRPL